MSSLGPASIRLINYGYNLNPVLFRERLKDGRWLSDGRHKTGSLDGPDPVDLGVYVLPGYEFTYDLDLQSFHERGTVGNVRAAARHRVLGALYRITEIQLRRLDRSEEVPRIYVRTQVKVYKEEFPESVIDAWIDIGHESAVTKVPHPEQDYVDEIVQSAISRDFPPSYIDQYLRFPQKAK